MTTPKVSCICTGDMHARTTALVRASLLSSPAKVEVVRPEVEMHMWAMSIRR